MKNNLKHIAQITFWLAMSAWAAYEYIHHGLFILNMCAAVFLVMLAGATKTWWKAAINDTLANRVSDIYAPIGITLCWLAVAAAVIILSPLIIIWWIKYRIDWGWRWR